jgi:hypothetical protein
MSKLNLALFKNDRKQTEAQPDYTGLGAVSKEDFMALCDQVTSGRFNQDSDGRIKLRVAGWLKESSSGKNYISLSVSVDDYQAAQPVSNAAPAKTDPIF